MIINIELRCPRCDSNNLARNGKKSNGPQNYLCNACKRQFIRDEERTYLGTLGCITGFIKTMLVRGCGVRDVAALLGISAWKVLKTLAASKYALKPKRKRYDCLEVDEFWTYVGRKKNRKWLIYAYHRETGEIVAYVWGKRDLKTARRLRRRLEEYGVSYGRIAHDDWDSFISAFAGVATSCGKRYTQGIEGSNCRLRHRIRRAFRRGCNFSKKLVNHLKAFSLAFQYLNHGYV